MISWDEVGGMQPAREKRIQSTQGHTFRIRSAGDGHMLMQHTLDDLVLRSCEEEEKQQREHELDALRIATAALQEERDLLRETYATKLNRLVLALKGAAANASAPQYHAVAPGGETALAGAASPLLGIGLFAAPKL